MNLNRRVALATALVAGFGLTACPPPPEPARNVKVATYNAAYLVSPKSSDGKFFDEKGNPLTNKERAVRMAERILASDVEILALNEVFDEDSRDELVSRLKAAFPYLVAYIGNDSDPSDSGLMLFSRHPFETMKLDSSHVYDCGDVEIGYGGTESECSDDRLGFAELKCSAEYADHSDCLASKGVGLVKVRLPMGESLYVGFSHFLASYPDDRKNPLLPGEIIPCVKQRDRRRALRQFEKLVEDAVAEEGIAPNRARVVLLGDLNINGNPFKSLDSACLDAEWKEAFASSSGLTFTACANLAWPACVAQGRVFVESWAFTTSPEDLGRTNGFNFALDLKDEKRRGEGERLDYVLFTGPAVPDANAAITLPQHLTLEYPLSGETGELSDHLPLAANLLLLKPDHLLAHPTPALAKPMVIPASGSLTTAAMEIRHPGQMQWLRFEGERGTYTFQASAVDGRPIGLDIYARTDLSRPIRPRRPGYDGGFVYLLNHPPYYLRTYAAQAGNLRAHDRLGTGEYTVYGRRHGCASYVDSCILNPGAAGDRATEATWPAGTPVGADDALWFELYADDPSGAQPATFHDFAVFNGPLDATLPSFDFQVVDFETQSPLPGVSWQPMPSHGHHLERRALGIHGKPGQGGYDNHLLKVLRPNLGFSGKVRVFHGTNLFYVKPQSFAIEQEEDDSAHDELKLYFKADTADSFYRTVAENNVHSQVGKFYSLPEIDELEDGGGAWPAAEALGTLRATDEVALVLVEDDDEDDDPEEGDYLLALSDPANEGMAANGFALAPLPSNQTGGQRTWKWTDEPGESDPDETSYFYRLSLLVTHCPPDFRCDG